MPFLGAQALTDDPKGLSRLKAVIATDPGYEMRAQHAADSVLPAGSAGFSGTPAVADTAPPCEALNASSLETPATSVERISSLVAGGVAVAGTAVASLAVLVSPGRDGSTALL